MAIISANDVKIGMRPATTWGTAVAVHSGGYLLQASQFSVSGAFQTFVPRDCGFSSLPQDVSQTFGDFNVSMTCDLSYDQAWLMILGQICGTEQNVVSLGSGAYSHTLEIASNNTGKFSTLIWLVESDRALEIPSVKWHSCTINLEAGTVGTFTAQGIANVIQDPTGSTAAQIAAMTYRTGYESAPLHGASAYCRIDSFSQSAALTVADDMPITNASIAITRGLQKSYALRGASTRTSYEPYQTGLTDGTLTVRLYANDDSVLDEFSAWKDAGRKMSEIKMVGGLIGGSYYKTLQFYLPCLEPTGEFPTGHDMPNPQTLLQPELKFKMLLASAIPAGMNGAMSLMMLSATDTLNAKWTATS